MIGYMPTRVTPDEPLELEPSIEAPTYAHPSRALADAQRLAATGSPAAVVIIDVSDEWAACCGECLVPVNGRHDCSERRRDVVFPWEAVYRPASTVRA